MPKLKKKVRTDARGAGWKVKKTRQTQDMMIIDQKRGKFAEDGRNPAKMRHT